MPPKGKPRRRRDADDDSDASDGSYDAGAGASKKRGRNSKVILDDDDSEPEASDTSSSSEESDESQDSDDESDESSGSDSASKASDLDAEPELGEEGEDDGDEDSGGLGPPEHDPRLKGLSGLEYEQMLTEIHEERRSLELERKLKAQLKQQKLETAKKGGKGGAGARKKAATPAKPAARKPRAKKLARKVVDDDDDSDVKPPPSASTFSEGTRVMRKRAVRQVQRTSEDEASDRDRSPSPPPPAEPARGVRSPSDDEDVRKRGRGGPGTRTVDDEDDDNPDARPVSDVAHLMPCLLPRAAIVKYHDEPFFPDMSRNAFVRVLATKRLPRKYIIAQIDAVVDAPKPYQVDGFTVDKILRLRLGNEEFQATSTARNIQQFPIDKISNSAPTSSEFAAWVFTVRSKFHQPLPTIQWCKERGEKMIDTRKNFKYTEAVVEQMAKKRSKDVKKMPNLTFARLRLHERVTAYQEEVDALVASLAEDPDNVVTQGELNDAREKLKEEQQRLLEVENEIKRRKVVEDKSVAMKKLGINKIASEYNKSILKKAHTHQTLADRVADDSRKFNPFTRQPCEPVVLWKVNSVGIADEDTSAGTPKNKDAAAAPAAVDTFVAEEGPAAAAADLPVHHFLADQVVQSTEEAVASIIGAPAPLPSTKAPVQGNDPSASAAKSRLSFAAYLQAKSKA